MKTTENSLINSAQHGDMDAFNMLVLNYQDMLYRIALRIVHDECIAEDALQEAMVHAFAISDRFAAVISRAGWRV